MLTLRKDDWNRLPAACTVKEINKEDFCQIPKNDLIIVDWVNSSLSLVSELQKKAGLKCPDAATLKATFNSYFSTQRLSEKWKINTNKYLSLGFNFDAKNKE